MQRVAEICNYFKYKYVFKVISLLSVVLCEKIIVCRCVKFLGRLAKQYNRGNSNLLNRYILAGIAIPKME